ncbi:terminase large subunit domain-containing protein [Mycobacterium sp.]|uniref:terminase large subunit domain-containing protein n=1 Tax=Mycobacterium sp. TaxID=1785 RepID=UPI003F98443E
MTAIQTLVAARALAAQRAKQRPKTPAELAKLLDPKFVVTPTISLLSNLAVRSVTEPQRDVVSTSPRTGKSRLLAIWTVVWALSRNPDMQIMVIGHSDELAQDHSRSARRIINEHSDYLGIRLSPDKTSVGHWTVDGHAGKLLAQGVNSGAVGFGADLLILDDIVKDREQAESVAHRRRILNEYRSSLASRVHPGGSILLVMSRWHPDDLAGVLLREEPDVWRHTNIPAVSEAGIPDALGREPGVAFISALGYTPEHFAAIRRTSGERVWYSMYEGVPAAPEGGLVKAVWLDNWRMPCAPTHPVFTVIGVDPADSGEGDAAGIIACSLTAEGVVAVIADKSAVLTSDAWARAAVELAVDVGASEIAVEAFAAGATYTRVVKEALSRYKLNRPIRITAWPPRGSQRGRGDAMARAAALLQGLETGSCRLAGHLPDFEQAAVTWQAGQHCPDSLSALVVAFDTLVHSTGQQWSFAAPLAGSITDRAPVTSMTEFLRRRVL